MIGKIAFLFLTLSEINHEQPWINFFQGQDARCSIYIHSKHDFNPRSYFKKREIKAKVPTTWEKITGAQLQLLKDALQDPQNEKFIFLSESTIPLQSFDFVYQKLMNHPHSLFSYERNPEPSRIFTPLQPFIIYKNSTWIVLNRKHAQLMVEDQGAIKIMSQYPFDCEHYPSTFLKIHNLLHEVKKEDVTYDLWSLPGPHPWTFRDFKNEKYFAQMVSAIRKGYLFGRKFAKECDLSPLKPYISSIK